VTERCNSRCKTCKIWMKRTQGKELEVYEWDRILAQIGRHIGFYTFSGGEPFMRRDLPELLSLPFEYGNPRFLTVPTNGLLPDRVHDYLECFFQNIEGRDIQTEVYCNVSVDAVGYLHDEIRGVEGNFSKVLETIENLKKIRARRRQLKIGIHTLISRFNLNEISSIYDRFLPLDHIDSMGCSIAEERHELGTTGESIAPSKDETREILDMLTSRISPHKKLNRTLKSLRVGYYDFLKKWITCGRQPMSCFAARSSCQITADGNVVSCGARWTEEGLIGNLREVDYDFRKIWYSPQADRVRSSIRQGACSCPQLHVYYGTVACHPIEMSKIVLKRMVRAHSKRL